MDKERKVDKVRRLKQWIKDEVCKRGAHGQFGKFVEIVKDDGESNPDRSAYEFRFLCNIYTENNRYRITARDRSEDEGYLGCTVSDRKSRAGEDWTRGRDLADGKFTRETWEDIKNDIIRRELVPLATQVEPVEKEKEAVGEEKEPKESEEKEPKE